jgi:hypothetical protein
MTPSGLPLPAPALIGEFLQFVLPAGYAVPPDWPPDVFAVAAALLHKSGAYSYLLEGWPSEYQGENWAAFASRIGQEWRQNLAGNISVAPAPVAEWWQILAGAAPVCEVQQTRARPDLCEALIRLCAVADEACWGFGIPESEQLKQARANLNEDLSVTRTLARKVRQILLRGDSSSVSSPSAPGSTLCRQIHPSRLRVLPKLHIPQHGFNIRSLSRNLALCTADEIRPVWNLIARHPGDESMNLLLVPWPAEVRPSQFASVTEDRPSFGHGPGRYRFFTWKPDENPDAVPDIAAILAEAERVAGPVAGVVLPELSLTAGQYPRIWDALLARDCFLICGLCGDKKNYVRFELPLKGQDSYARQQSKHHRWLLDQPQIVQYGLGSVLSPAKLWWEHIDIAERSLQFSVMRDWLTISVLICEDLARPDPVGDVVRAVGPNLVIALLMDGPQLASRWPGRYATVLADDPGCSVLSLTSIGMCRLSRPPHIKSASRVVALWKDARSGTPVEIELPQGADAIVLSLTVEYLEEWTADGRSDLCTTGYPTLAGIHPITARPRSAEVQKA